MKPVKGMEISEVESLVLDTLKRATSQNTEILKPAEQKLKEWEIEPGFYSILMKIISNHSIDVTVRWLAVLFFKNGVDRYWRKTAPNAIQETEKATLRNGLLESFREPINQVATQLAVLISKAARYDYPREWPELMPTLLELVKSEDQLIQHRALLTFHHVIKTLESKRLGTDRRLFQQLAAEIFSFVLNLWNSHFETFFSQVQNNDPNCQTSLERALLSLKILRRFTVHGFKQPHEVQDVVMFITLVFDRAKNMLHCRRSFENKSQSLTELAEKVIIQLTKVLISLLEQHPFSFISFIQPSLQFSVAFLFTQDGEGLLFERFIIQCLNLIKGILICAEYKTRKLSDHPDKIDLKNAALEADRIKADFFTNETLAEICMKLITHYFLLTREDLLLWGSDPESFARDDVGESWKYSLRPCTESVFNALFHEFRDTLAPVLLNLIIQNNQQVINPQDMDAILRKDAIYNAVGLAAFDLYDEVDFDRWFSTTLVQELAIKEPNYRIIRRRVASLIGTWTGVKLSPELRPAIYNALIPMLQRDEDMVVRLTAAVALKYAVDDFEFSSDQFMDFLEPAFTLLFALLQEAKECDTKMQVLYVLSFIVERVGVAIRPYSASLIQYLPILWEESVNHNMLRCAIVSTLVQFVRALVSENLTSFLFPVIELCTDVTQDAHVYLLDDGLELWYAVLENSTNLSPQLFHLYKVMPSILNYTVDYLQCCCFIIQAYILISPQEFLVEYGESVVTSCLDLLTDMNADGMILIMQVVETAVRVNASLAVNLSLPILSNIILSIHRGEDLPLVMGMSLAIACRILLYSKEVFSQVIETAARSKSETSECFLDRILTVWNNTMPLVTQKEKKKLLALALSSLLTVQSRVVMSQFPSILKNIVEALNDIVDTDELSTQIDSLLLADQFSSNEDSDSNLETENEKRKKQLADRDPVYNIALKDYLQSQFNDLKNQLGATNFEGLLQTVDSDTLQQCRLYIAF